jgi:hypothetical protein
MTKVQKEYVEGGFGQHHRLIALAGRCRSESADRSLPIVAKFQRDLRRRGASLGPLRR